MRRSGKRISTTALRQNLMTPTAIQTVPNRSPAPRRRTNRGKSTRKRRRARRKVPKRRLLPAISPTISTMLPLLLPSPQQCRASKSQSSLPPRAFPRLLPCPNLNQNNPTSSNCFLSSTMAQSYSLKLSTLENI